MAKRAEAFIIYETDYGNRLGPSTTQEAEDLVKKGDAKKVRAGLYQRTKKTPQPTEQTRMLAPIPAKSKRR